MKWKHSLSISQAEQRNGFACTAITPSCACSGDGEFRGWIPALLTYFFNSSDFVFVSSGRLLCEGSGSYSRLIRVVFLHFQRLVGLRLGLFSPIPPNNPFSRRRSRYTNTTPSYISAFDFSSFFHCTIHSDTCFVVRYLIWFGFFFSISLSLISTRSSSPYSSFCIKGVYFPFFVTKRYHFYKSIFYFLFCFFTCTTQIPLEWEEIRGIEKKLKILRQVCFKANYKKRGWIGNRMNRCLFTICLHLQQCNFRDGNMSKLQTSRVFLNDCAFLL